MPPAELTLVIRTSEQETLLGSELQAIASSLNGDVPVTQVETMNGWLRDVAAGSNQPAHKCIRITLSASEGLPSSALDGETGWTALHHDEHAPRGNSCYPGHGGSDLGG